jgi:hypothetical protein
MSAAIRFDIDLNFRLDGVDGTFEGSIRAAGSTIEILVSHPEAFVERTRASLARIRQFAGAPARRGVVVRLSGPAGMVGELGAIVRA